MRTRIVLAAGALTLVAAGTVPALAAPGDNGNGVGGCIAGTLYGNTTNPRPSGHGTLPSESPGPWDNTTDQMGMSLGQIIHANGGGSNGNPGDLVGNPDACPFS